MVSSHRPPATPVSAASSVKRSSFASPTTPDHVKQREVPSSRALRRAISKHSSRVCQYTSLVGEVSPQAAFLANSMQAARARDWSDVA